MTLQLFIKRIVSKKCEQNVRQVFKQYGFDILVQPGGLVIVDKPVEQEILFSLAKSLKQTGHGLIEDNRAGIISKTKALLEKIVTDVQLKKIKLGEYLSARLPYEYHYLSSMFSQLEGVTIESFFIELKINAAKELIEEGKLNISEIAYKLGYSSPAHLTNQFRKTVGLTPSAYRENFYKR